MMPLAFLIMVVLVTIAFLVNVYSRRMSDVQHARLLRLAYKDDMTGLYNRTKGEEILAMLKQEKAPYALVNMDLNFLKKVNDAYGHEAGDAYIKKFAQLLRSTFVNMPICRMGGDEFLVIVTGVDAVWATVRDRLAALNEAIAACNRETDGRFLVDVSVGVARSDETRDGEPESVYRLADKRMYDMKRESKKGRKEE
jgi:diguanylate cyclase (GGDEF)-like protein